MKKICCFLLLSTLIFSIFIKASADSILDDLPHEYETSGGYAYNLEDFDIFLYDFEDQEFESSQEVIDHIYDVGTNRLNTRESSSTNDNRIDFLFIKLTPDELDLFIDNPEYIPQIFFSSITAVLSTEIVFPEANDDGQRGNAFQHSYWTIMLCELTTPEFALAYVTAHENWDGNDSLHKSMDLYNNNVAHSYYVTNNLASMDYSVEELGGLMMELLDDGGLIYIIKGYTYPKAYVYNSITGVTTTSYATGDFYAYTNSTVPYNVPDPEYIVFPPDPGTLYPRPYSK